MKFQGTLLGLVFKAFAALGAVVGGVKLFAGLTSADNLEAKLAGAVDYQFGLAFLSSAVVLWWMGAVVDYLARIAANTAPRAQQLPSAPPPRGSSGGGHGHDDPAIRPGKAEGSNTYVLD